MTEPDYPALVEVEWTDATNIATWTDLHGEDSVAEWAREGGFICRNVGYLVHEDEDCIVLAARIALVAEPQQAGLFERLPKTIITGWRTLRPAGGHPMSETPSTETLLAAAPDPLRAMDMPTRDWVYDATLDRLSDGDTVWLLVDLGGRVFVRWRCRMRGYDAEPRNTEEGKEATAALGDLLTDDNGRPARLRIVTEKDASDLYGRWLARVWLVSDGVEVGPAMVEAGHGVAWDGAGGHPTV